MKAFRDVEGTLPAQPGDRVGRIETSLPEFLQKEASALIQGDVDKRPVLVAPTPLFGVADRHGWHPGCDGKVYYPGDEVKATPNMRAGESGYVIELIRKGPVQGIRAGVPVFETSLPFKLPTAKVPLCACKKTMEWSEPDKCWFCDDCEGTAHEERDV